MRYLGLVLGASLISGCAFLEKTINTTRAYNYVGVSHLASGGDGTAFDERIPGLSIGSEAPTRFKATAVGVETGIYRDPNRDNSIYGLGYAERDIFPTNAPRRVRAGAFVGFSQYDGGGEELFDEVYLTGGLQLTVSTFGRHELRLRAMPGVGDSDLTFFLGSNIKF